MVRTSPGVSGARGSIGGASLISMISAGVCDSSPAIAVGQCLLVGRVTALPFELVHAERFLCNATEGRPGFVPNLGGKPGLRQRAVRMGASRESTSQPFDG